MASGGSAWTAMRSPDALAVMAPRRRRLAVRARHPDARVAVELDGAQHLADPVAYRRDRKKDQLLQENGYLVLRFLAEDVGKELDLVLNAILRSLSQRQSGARLAAPLNFVSHASSVRGSARADRSPSAEA